MSQISFPNSTTHRENTIFVPSGDQDGLRSWNPSPCVNLALPVPLRFITQMSLLRVFSGLSGSTLETVKAILVPVGDHDGATAAWPANRCVSCRRSVPSGRMVKIWDGLLKSVENAIRPLAPGNVALAGVGTSSPNASRTPAGQAKRLIPHPLVSTMLACVSQRAQG